MRVVHICRKPCSKGTVAKNVLEHGTGALNIGGCRLGDDTSEMSGRSGTAQETNFIYGKGVRNPGGGLWEPEPGGRWPANLILQHRPDCGETCAPTCPVRALDASTGVLQSGTGAVKRESSSTAQGNQGAAYGAESRPAGTPMVCYGDSGGASRFFKQVTHGKLPRS